MTTTPADPTSRRPPTSTPPCSCGSGSIPNPEPRARLLTVTDGEEPASWGTAVGRDDITHQVSTWVDYVTTVENTP